MPLKCPSTYNSKIMLFLDVFLKQVLFETFFSIPEMKESVRWCPFEIYC